MIGRITDRKEMERHAGGWSETVILTCLEGRIGSVWGDEKSALFTAGEFVLFTGEPSRELVAFKPPTFPSVFALMTAKDCDPRWLSLIAEVFGERAKRIERYAIKKEGLSSFDLDKLGKMASSVPDGYELRRADREIYDFCAEDAVFHDLVSQYPTWRDYEERGLGFFAVKDGEIAAGCSSFSDYAGGLEIEIATHPDHRRLGLATAVAASFISECVRRGIYPSWDAGNASSLALAEKLGYRLERAYPAYEIEDYS